MVLSAVSCLHQLSCVDSNVTGYSLIRLLDQLVRRQQVSDSVALECFVFVSTSVTSNAAQTVQEGPRLLKCDLGSTG